MSKHKHTFIHLRHEDDHIVDWLACQPFFAEVDIFFCSDCLEYKTKILRDTSEMIVQRTNGRMESRNKERKRGWF
jgi:hypothetical protein